MEYKTLKAKYYHYQCNDCGKEIIKDFEFEPNKCHKCGGQFAQTVEFYEVKYQFCPICNSFFETSTFLNENIEDIHVRWLANMVTHYRHNHITSWNNMWGDDGHIYRRGWNGYKDYDTMKHEVNERAKRQILRKCKQYLIDNGFTVQHIEQLQNTDNETIALYQKYLKTS